MALTYGPKNPANKLRLLLLGGMGTRKSTSVLEVMERCPGSHFHIVDTDEAFEMQVEGFDKVLENQNYTLYPCELTDWKAQINSAREASAACEPGDFYVFDCVSETWNAVQGWGRENKLWSIGKGDKIIEGSLNYAGEINPEYFQIYKTFRTTPGHLIVTSDVQAISDKDEKEMRVEFGPFGCRPKAQKSLWRYFHSVVLLKRTREEWTATGIRERNKTLPLLDEEEYEDFFKTYFLGVQGWKPRKVDG